MFQFDLIQTCAGFDSIRTRVYIGLNDFTRAVYKFEGKRQI